MASTSAACAAERQTISLLEAAAAALNATLASRVAEVARLRHWSGGMAAGPPTLGVLAVWHCCNAPTRLAVARGRGQLLTRRVSRGCALCVCAGPSRLARRVVRGMRPLRYTLQRSGTACCAALWCAQCTAVCSRPRAAARGAAPCGRGASNAHRAARGRAAPARCGTARCVACCNAVRCMFPCCALHVAMLCVPWCVLHVA